MITQPPTETPEDVATADVLRWRADSEFLATVKAQPGLWFFYRDSAGNDIAIDLNRFQSLPDNDIEALIIRAVMVAMVNHAQDRIYQLGDQEGVKSDADSDS